MVVWLSEEFGGGTTQWARGVGDAHGVEGPGKGVVEDLHHGFLELLGRLFDLHSLCERLQGERWVGKCEAEVAQGRGTPYVNDVLAQHRTKNARGKGRADDDGIERWVGPPGGLVIVHVCPCTLGQFRERVLDASTPASQKES